MGPLRILVVNDERHIVRLLQVNLERNGYEVFLAHNGQQAIDLLKSNSYDRAIIDYGMPNPNGYQVLEFIRTNEATKDMWVGLMVSKEESPNVESLPCKADWYSSKPFNPNEPWI